MTIDQWLSASLDVISFLGFVVVIIQLRDSNRQTKLESQVRVQDSTRELVSLGFANPQLFEALKGSKHVDPAIGDRYLQLWLNHFSMIHSFLQSGVLDKDVQKSFEADVRDIMQRQNMRHHWRVVRHFYPASFQTSVDEILRETGNEVGETLKP